MALAFEDPKTTILNLLQNNFSVTKDDESAAKFATYLEMPEESIKGKLKKADVILTVGRESEISKRIGLAAVFQYVGVYRIGVWTIEKANINGEGICTRGIQKIKAIIKANEKSPGGNLSFIKKVNTRDDDRPGSPTLFHRLVSVETWHFGQEES